MKIKVTREDIDDIMIAALEGGITYWCCKAEVVGNTLETYVSEQIGRGGALRLYDNDGSNSYFLNVDRLLAGIKKYIAAENKPHDILCRASDNTGCRRIDSAKVDAAVADMIIQYAVMGEIVYG